MEIGNLLLKKEHRLRLTTVTDTSVTRYIFVGIGILKLVSEKNGLFWRKRDSIITFTIYECMRD